MLAFATPQVQTGMLFLSLLSHHRDAAVIEKFVKQGKMPALASTKATSLSYEDDACWQNFDSAVDDSEGVDLQWEMARIRQIRDTLDNSVQALYNKDPEVKDWADKLGGLRAVQERLVGLKLNNKSWYKRTLKRLAEDIGYMPSPLGEPTIEVPIETATSHNSYAVQVHRELINRKAHGELQDDDTTTPNWAASIFDFNISQKPWWWNQVFIGRFKQFPKLSDKPNFRQTETRKGHGWMLDIRLSKSHPDNDGVWIPNRFEKLIDIAPLNVALENQKVKDFIWKFYNDPNQLTRMKVGQEPKTRWAFGMRVKGNQWLWAPVTYKSSKTIDFFTSPMQKRERKLMRALYFGEWVIPYRKAGEGFIKVQELRQCQNTGLWQVWKDKVVDWQSWGRAKKAMLKRGAKDAYFGYPWREYQAPKRDIEEVL